MSIPVSPALQMIDLPIHIALSITSSAIIGTAALVIAFLRIPQGGSWSQFSHARWVLFATFGLLSLSGCFKVSDEVPQLLSLATLSVASFQALLFTYTSSVLVAPAHFSPRKFAIILALVTLCCLALAMVMLLSPPLYRVLWPVALLAYAAQLVVHTRMFGHIARRAQANLEEFYDEDVNARLHPVRQMFYSALGIGVMALVVCLLPMNNLCYNIFVACYTLYYLMVAITMVNYVADGHFFMQAAEYEPDAHPQAASCECAPSAFEPALRTALDRWVERRLYLETELGTDLIASQLGVTRQQLAAYMRSEYGMTFRSWRLRLRLQYAQELIASDGDVKLSQLYERVGFNDRSNFHKEFCKYTGMTPQAYRDRYGRK